MKIQKLNKKGDGNLVKYIVVSVSIIVLLFAFFILVGENRNISYNANSKLESTGELYSEKTKTGNVKFNDKNEMTSDFLDNSFFKIKYNNSNSIPEKENKKPKSSSNKKTDTISTKTEKVDTEFYKIKKYEINNSNTIRYINRSIVSSAEVVLGNALFEYSDSVPTISSYIPEAGYYFYGNGNYYRDLKIVNEYNVARHKTVEPTSCPVIVTSANAFVIEFHKEGLNDVDVDIFYSAIRKAVGDYGIKNIKESDFYTADSLIYYMDGLSVKQIGRLARNGDTIIFFMYFDDIDEVMFEDLMALAKLKQNWVTSVGDLNDLNTDIDSSIKEKIVEYFLEAEGYDYNLGNFTAEEEKIKSTLWEEMQKEEWLIDAQWGSPYIESEKESYEYSVILNEKPINNIVEFDIETEGLKFYYQGELTDQEIAYGGNRPSSVIGSYAVYYDNQKRDNEYKTGKVMHIYRPKVIDNESNWEWANLSIDEKNGKLSISIDQKFLDNAIYPLVVDPTIGYTTQGGTAQSINNDDYYGTVFPGVNGDVNRMYFYVSAKNHQLVAGIYTNGTNGTLIENGKSVQIQNSGSTGWFNTTFDTDPTLSASNDYIFVLSRNETGSYGTDFYYDSLGTDEVGVIKESGYAGDMPDTLEFTRDTRTYSIYANYTEAVYPEKLKIELVTPSGDVNVSQNELFKVELNVTCTNATCGTINVSLDPIEEEWNISMGTVYNYGHQYDAENSLVQVDETHALNFRHRAYGGALTLLETNFTDGTVSTSHEIIFGGASTGDGKHQSIAKLNETHYVGVQYVSSLAKAYLFKVNNTAWTVSTVDSIDYLGDSSVSSTAIVNINGTNNFLTTYNGGNAMVLTTDGSTISNSTNFSFDTGTIYNNSIVAINDTHFLNVYENGGGKAVVLEVDGTTITKPGSIFEFTSGSADYNSLVKINNTHYLNVYDDYAVILILDGVTITKGTTYDFFPLGDSPSVAKIDDENYLYTCSRGADGLSVLLNVNGTIITNLASESFNSDGITYNNRIVKMNDTHFLNVYTDSSPDLSGAVIISADTYFTKGGLIPTGSGIPFYTTASTNPLTTSSLSENQSEIITFWVNATGEINSTWDFFAFANMTSNTFVNNITEHWDVTIVEAGPDTTSPTYSSNSTNNSIAGASTLFSILWDDNVALHPAGQYIFSTNNSGTWVNDSAVNFTSTPNWANITKVLNSTVGTSVGFRWFADDNAGNSENTPIYTVTAVGSSPPGVSNITWTTVGGFTDDTLAYNQMIDYIKVNCTDDTLVGCNITITDPDDIAVVDNIAMDGESPWFNYSTDLTLNKVGVWNINITGWDTEDNRNSSSLNITVSITSQSLIDGFFGYDTQTIPSNATISDLSGYDYDVLETYDDATSLNSNWSSVLEAISRANELNVRIGLKYFLDYDLSSDTTSRDNFRNNITDLFDELLSSPYLETVEYIKIDVNLTAGYSDTEITVDNLNLIGKNILDATGNYFAVYTNYNSSTLDEDYIQYEADILNYITATDRSSLINELANLTRTKTSKTRIYYNLDNNQKATTQTYQNNIMIFVTETINTSTVISQPLVSELANGDLIVYNNGSTSQNYTYDLSNGIDVVGKDIWDYTNGILLANTSNNGTITFLDVSPYSAIIVGTEEIDHLAIDSGKTSATVYGQTTAVEYKSNHTDGVRESASAGTNSRGLEVWDNSYSSPTSQIYYGWLNVTGINSPYQFDGLTYLIIADQNDAEIDKLFWQNVSIANVFGYVAVADYNDTDPNWLTNKKAEVDTWIAFNESINIFLDGLDAGNIVNTTAFEADVKNLSDYIKITKGKELGINVFTEYQAFAQLSSDNGFAMKESCIYRWQYVNGVNDSDGYNYSNQYWEEYNGYGDYSKSLWYNSHNVNLLCVPFMDRTTGSYSPNNTNYTLMQQIYFRAKVLGYEHIAFSTPVFDISYYDKNYDLGTKLQSQPTVDGDVYSMRYTKGTVYYNLTSDYSWFDDGVTFNNGSIDLMLHDNTAFNYDICVNDYCGYSVTTAGDGWSYDWHKIYINETVFDDSSGHYLIQASSSDGGFIGDDTNSLDTYGKHSYYDNSGTWVVEADSASNHMYNLNLNISYSTTLDDTDNIGQSEVNLSDGVKNLTITSPYDIPKKIWTAISLPVVGVFHQVSVWVGGTGFVELTNYSNSSACLTTTPEFLFNNILGIGSIGLCIDTSDGIRFRVEVPELTSGEDMTFQINADATLPTISINSPTNDTYTTSIIIFNVTATDEILIDSCTYSLDSGANQTLANTASNYWTHTNSSMTQGSHSVNFYCNDSSGNWNTSESVSFFIDSLNPSVTSLTETPSDPATYLTGATYQFNATITDTNLLTVLFESSGNNFTASNIIGNIYNFTTSDLSAGTYNYRWYAIDDYGNINGTETGSYTINKADPNLGISGTTPITYGTITDVSGSNCPAQLSCSLDKTNAIYGVGVETFNYSAPGNQNYTSDYITKSITINKATPTGSLTSSLGWVINESQSITIGLSESNTGDGDLTYIVYRDGVSKATGETWSPALGTYDYILNTTGGENYSAVANIDSQTLQVNDVTNPLINYINNTEENNTYLNQNFILVNVSVAELHEDTIIFNLYNSSNYNLNSSLFTDLTRTINWTNLTDGVYYYNVTVNDTSGNENSTETRIITLDSTYPNISIITPADGYNIYDYVSGSVPIDVNFSVNETNLDTCTYEITGPQNISATVVSCSDGYNNFSTSISTSGNFVLTVYANDTAGNENSSSINIIISAYTGPQAGGGETTDPDARDDAEFDLYNSTIMCHNVDEFLRIYPNYNYNQKENLKNKLAIELGFAVSNKVLNKYLAEFEEMCPDFIAIPETPVVPSEPSEEISYKNFYIFVGFIILIIIILLIFYDQGRLTLLIYEMKYQNRNRS